MAISKLSRNKRGIFLTIIAISMLGAFILLFAPDNFELDTGEATNNRVKDLSTFRDDLQDGYLDQLIQSSSTKVILSLIEYAKIQDTLLSDFQGAFIEVMVNGTIGGTDIDTITGQSIMSGYTFDAQVATIRTAAQNAFLAETTIVLNDMSVYQIEPWSIQVQSNVTISVAAESVSWYSNATILTDVPITWFEDPYLAVNSHGSILQRINKTSTLSTGWNETNVDEHIYYGTYVHFEDSLAPSFIGRFENRTDASSCCGIETILDPTDAGVGDEIQSYVDYLWYNNSVTSCSELYNITEWPIYDGLKLEIGHRILYNIPATGYVDCE